MKDSKGLMVVLWLCLLKELKVSSVLLLCDGMRQAVDKDFEGAWEGDSGGVKQTGAPEGCSSHASNTMAWCTGTKLAELAACTVYTAIFIPWKKVTRTVTVKCQSIALQQDPTNSLGFLTFVQLKSNYELLWNVRSGHANVKLWSFKCGIMLTKCSWNQLNSMSISISLYMLYKDMLFGTIYER
jgi:hypothetical protein